jgi:hypothetical protein
MRPLTPSGCGTGTAARRCPIGRCPPEDLDNAPFAERGGIDGAIRDLGPAVSQILDSRRWVAHWLQEMRNGSVPGVVVGAVLTAFGPGRDQRRTGALLDSMGRESVARGDQRRCGVAEAAGAEEA